MLKARSLQFLGITPVASTLSPPTNPIDTDTRKPSTSFKTRNERESFFLMIPSTGLGNLRSTLSQDVPSECGVVGQYFPNSVDGILQVNSAFIEEMRRIVDDTEEEALRDMETPIMGFTGSKIRRTKDHSSALAIAKSFLE
ncbi:hypothetical protein ACHAPU_008082 [Fusarium lateritium]